jgi:2-phospho-L-lactate/phosphoenolpyruvate guanylyltransferase
VAIVPDRHGTGTNALLLCPPDAIGPAFGLRSRERHSARAAARGHQVAIEEVASLGLDLDTPEDLRALAALLAEAPERGPATAAELSRLGFGVGFRESA